MTTFLIPAAAILAAVLLALVFIVAVTLRKVVPTNMVHIVQRKKTNKP